MIKCLFIRRKLYDYLENSLSKNDSDKVKRHLESCVSCRRQSEGITRIIEVTERKKAPQVSEESWKDFKAGLYTKLAQRLIPSVEVKPRVNYLLRPAWALSTILVLVLTVSFYFRFKPLYVKTSDAAIVNEAILLEEVSPDIRFGSGDNGSLEELNIFYQLGVDLDFS